MLNLVDRRGWRAPEGPNEFPTRGDRSGEPPLEVVTHRGKVYLRPQGPHAGALEEVGPAWSVGDWLRAGLTALVVLVLLVYAARSFTVLFTETFEAASRALPAGSLTAPRADAVQALARERDRRREALAGYDRHIAGTKGDPPLQAAWLDLKRREVEAVEQLERHLGRLRRSHPPPATADQRPLVPERSRR